MKWNFEILMKCLWKCQWHRELFKLNGRWVKLKTKHFLPRPPSQTTHLHVETMSSSVYLIFFNGNWTHIVKCLTGYVLLWNIYLRETINIATNHREMLNKYTHISSTHVQFKGLTILLNWMIPNFNETFLIFWPYLYNSHYYFMMGEGYAVLEVLRVYPVLWCMIEFLWCLRKKLGMFAISHNFFQT